jgi:hypothetical protein
VAPGLTYGGHDPPTRIPLFAPTPSETFCVGRRKLHALNVGLGGPVLELIDERVCEGCEGMQFTLS